MDINIDLKGLGNVIEELKQTKVLCEAADCQHHQWVTQRRLNERCTLDSVGLNKRGVCAGYKKVRGVENPYDI